MHTFQTESQQNVEQSLRTSAEDMQKLNVYHNVAAAEDGWLRARRLERGSSNIVMAETERSSPFLLLGSLLNILFPHIVGKGRYNPFGHLLLMDMLMRNKSQWVLDLVFDHVDES